MRLIGLLIIGLTILAYANSVAVPFVFDDQASFVRNPIVLFNPSLLNPRGLLFWTYRLNYKLGASPISWHVVNLLLHLAVGGLVYLLANVWMEPLAAWLATGLFLLHPIQTESVTYVSSRSEVLSTLFVMAGLVAFFRYQQVLLGALCVIPGLLSKETAIVLPMVLIPALIHRREWPKVSILAGVGVAAVASQLSKWSSLRQLEFSHHFSLWQYALTECRVFWKYLGLLAWPSLNLDWDVSISKGFGLVECAAIIGLLWLATIAMWSETPAIRYGVLILLTVLIPRSIVPLDDLMVEHRMYFPMVGIALLSGRLLSYHLNLTPFKELYGER